MRISDKIENPTIQQISNNINIREIENSTIRTPDVASILASDRFLAQEVAFQKSQKARALT